VHLAPTPARDAIPLRSPEPLRSLERRPLPLRGREAGSLRREPVPLEPAEGKDGRYERRLRKAAEGFEALFYSEMIREMRRTIGGEGLFGKTGRAVYEGMFDTMLAEELARAGHLGIADLFLEQGVTRR